MLLFNSWYRHKEGYYKMFHHERQLNVSCAWQNLFQPFLWGWRYTFFRITHGNILPEGTAEHILAPPFLTLAKIYIGRGQRYWRGGRSAALILRNRKRSFILLWVLLHTAIDPFSIAEVEWSAFKMSPSLQNIIQNSLCHWAFRHFIGLGGVWLSGGHFSRTPIRGKTCNVWEKQSSK